MEKISSFSVLNQAAHLGFKSPKNKHLKEQNAGLFKLSFKALFLNPAWIVLENSENSKLNFLKSLNFLKNTALI